MLTVSADRDEVERQLGSGGLACPACGGVLAGQVRCLFTALAAGLASDPPLPVPAGSLVADAVSRGRFCCHGSEVPGVGDAARWHLAAAVSCRMLLAPCWRAGLINASWPWAARV